MSDQFTDVDYVIPLDIPMERIVHRIRKMEDGTVAEIVGAESEVRLTKQEKFSYALNRKTGLVCLELVSMAGSAYPSCKEVFIDVAKAIDDSVVTASLDVVVNGQGTSFIFYRNDGEGQSPD
jgi:hypothetical protein